jgi:flavin-dependent dehydrogenase
VTLLDEARFPRDKVCGEGVSPEAWRLLRELGAEAAVRGLAPQPLRGMRLFAPDGTSFVGRYGADRCGLGVRRAVFDAALLGVARDAGVVVREGVRVHRLLRDHGALAGVAVTEPGPKDQTGSPRSRGRPRPKPSKR